MKRAPMQHKTPQTLADAISFDQQRREAAYREWLALKQRFQEEQTKNYKNQPFYEIVVDNS